MALAKEIIRSRMVEWRNLKKLHAAQGVRIAHLEAENKALKAENAALKATVASQAADIQTLKLQLEELRTIVFGKAKIRKGKDDDTTPGLPAPEPKARTKDSYHRPLPKEEDITHREHHPLSVCPHGHPVTNKTVRIFYTHDIPAVVKPEITQHTIETGYCATCKKQVTAAPIPPAPVMFGSRIKRMVATLATVLRLSHPQIQSLLSFSYGTTVSDGEIAKMLAAEAERLRPEYERLKNSVQLSSIRHIDETSWEVCVEDGTGGKFCWVMSDALSPDRVYVLGKNRGKGVADDLLGDAEGVTVSDDYGAYRTLEKHQLCFAHLARDFRDLSRSPSLPQIITEHCRALTEQLSILYREIDTKRDVSLLGYFSEKLRELAAPFAGEPKKLQTLKTTLMKNIPQYLTALADPRIPLTNNRAERDIRHVVLKRKTSLGSRNATGAEHTGILLSCLMSRHGRGMLQEYLVGV